MYLNILFSIGFFSVFFGTFKAYAQEFNDVSLYVYNEPFEFFEDGVNLTEGIEGWYWDTFEVELETPIKMSGLGQLEFTSMEVSSIGMVSLKTVVGDYEYFLTLAPFLAIFVDPIIDPVNEDEGYVFYKYEDGTSFIEFRNVAVDWEAIILFSPLVSRLNLRIEIEHATGLIRYRYGPAAISLVFDYHMSTEGIGCMLEFKKSSILDEYEFFVILLINGHSFNPGYLIFVNEVIYMEPEYGLNFFPPNGMVYELNIMDTLTNVPDLNVGLGISIFPNPAENIIHISLHDFIMDQSGFLKIMDLSGHVLISRQINTDLSIDVSSLSAGAYILNFEFKGRTYSKKWVKQ